MRGRVPAKLAIASVVLAFGLGYWVAPKQPVDTEAKHTGFFQVDTTHVLATTVESLRDQNQLLVFSYKGSAQVEADRSFMWVFGGHQQLIVPAVVNYYIDLADLSLADVSYNDRAKLVTVKLPAVTLGDIAFQPENATTINGGLLTFSEEQVEALRKMNYAKARQSMVAQAQQPGLLKDARRQAKSDIEDYFAIPLRIAGQPDVKVVATFR